MFVRKKKLIEKLRRASEDALVQSRLATNPRNVEYWLGQVTAYDKLIVSLLSKS